jgi:starch synthase
MRIVLASSEAVPFSKTGGLADVAASLAKALDRAGHEVWLITPYYPRLYSGPADDEADIEPTGETLSIPIGSKRVSGTLLRSALDRSGVHVLLIDQRAYYDRPSLYGESGKDYKDNCERFVFFSRAILETARVLGLRPDVLHLNDWQTGLAAALLATECRQSHEWEQTASVFTIHNIAFQGEFWHWDMSLTGMDWKYFNWRQMEFFSHLNLLKTGIVFADMITTVSPSYAKEIQTPEFGAGLDGVLAARRDSLAGILNGVDTDVWNPRTDVHLVRNYATNDVEDGKAACKAFLQKRVGLPVRRDVPLLAMISRMTEQKGLDLVAESAERILKRDLQLVFLGSGEQKHEQWLSDLAARHPQKVAVKIGFDEPLAHQIEAGADAFLMPSRFEPCGLNQMYSLMYGTTPIVRRIGGLADTVVDASDENLAAGTADGFAFDDYASDSFCRQIDRAVEMFRDKRRWAKLVRTGMQKDFSWGRSAAEYMQVYRKALSKLTTPTSVS